MDGTAPPTMPEGAVPAKAPILGDDDVFIELCVLLTGLNDLLRSSHFRHIAAEYLRRLRGAGGAVSPQFERLFAAFRSLVDVQPRPPIDDALLARFRGRPEFNDNQHAARQLVNIVYFSQFQADQGDAPFLDGGFYEHGEVWRLIRTHPIGFSNQPYGYWTQSPAENPAPPVRR